MDLVVQQVEPFWLFVRIRNARGVPICGVVMRTHFLHPTRSFFSALQLQNAGLPLDFGRPQQCQYDASSIFETPSAPKAFAPITYRAFAGSISGEPCSDTVRHGRMTALHCSHLCSELDGDISCPRENPFSFALVTHLNTCNSDKKMQACSAGSFLPGFGK
jgi:hypothetical protein